MDDLIDKLYRIFSTDKQYEAAILKGKLEENNIPVVLVNKQDSSYVFLGEVEIHVANGEHFLKPEMRASVSLSTGEKRNVLLIPREAVKEIAGKPYVDVVMNGRAQRRTITVGRNQERTVEVVAGVREGDWVVVHSPSLLTANSRVRIAVEKADAER